MLKKYLNIENIFVLLSTLVLVSLILPLNINSAAIYMLMGFCLVIIFKRKMKWSLNSFILLCFVFFCLNAIHYFTDINTATSFAVILRKSSFVLLPFLWINISATNIVKKQSLVLLLYSYIITIVGVVLVLIATYNYFNDLDFNVFLYHEFSKVLGLSAIYTSLLFSLSLSILFENYLKNQTKVLLGLILFSTLIILLLSSKIFVIIIIFIYIFYIIKLQKSAKFIILAFIFFLLLPLLFNGNSIVKRFSDIKIDNIFSLNKKITPSTSFDGFELRKELVSIGIELSRQDLETFLYGIGPGDTQDVLNTIIIKKRFYVGNNNSERGFLNYNFHNQYIQTLVETGIAGLLVLFSLLLYLIGLGIQQKSSLLFLFNIIFATAFLTESYLNRQVGIVAFVSFNSILLLAENNISFSIQQFLKRFFDLIISLLVIIFVLSWFMPIFLILIAIETKTNPIFKQERAGLNARPFICYKLRTMMVNTTQDETTAIIGDSRITKMGFFLRRTAIDELPQFFNVFLGNMSVVGPRPLMLKEEKEYNKLIKGFSDRLVIKPGITGLAQANGYKGYVNNLSDIVIRYKLDLLYAKKQSLFLDIRIMLQTIIYLIKNNN